jgi:hypothetical protein
MCRDDPRRVIRNRPIRRNPTGIKEGIGGTGQHITPLKRMA